MRGGFILKRADIEFTEERGPIVSEGRGGKKESMDNQSKRKKNWSVGGWVTKNLSEKKQKKEEEEGI